MKHYTGPEVTKEELAQMAKLISRLQSVYALKTRAYRKQRKAANTAAPSAPRCTCPSGDGSLAWPCPAHPAPAEVQ